MSRAHPSLLFGPLLLDKGAGQISNIAGRRDFLPGAAEELFVTDHFTLLRDNLHNLRVLRDDFSSDTSQSHRALSSSVVAATRDTYLWGDESGFSLKTCKTGGTPLYFKTGLGHKPLGVHLTKEYIYAAHLEKAELVISRIVLENEASSKWREVQRYSFFYQHPIFIAKGDHAVIFFSEAQGRNCILIFDEMGVDGPLLLQDEAGIITGANKKPLITPEKNNDSYSYFALLRKTNGRSLLTHTSAPTGIVKREVLTEFSKQERVIDIASQGQEGLLLLEDDLLLFSKKGITRTFSLRDLQENYDRVTFGRGYALLWKRGQKCLQKIDILPF